MRMPVLIHDVPEQEITQVLNRYGIVKMICFQLIQEALFDSINSGGWLREGRSRSKRLLMSHKRARIKSSSN